MRQQRDLWKRSFGDSDEYIDYYFEHKVPKSICLTDYEDETLCSMAFLTPYEADLFGEVKSIPYLVGVATDFAYRHQGKMTKMLKEAFAQLCEKGVPLVFLSPADAAIYKGLGFASYHWRETMVLCGRGEHSLQICPWAVLKRDEKNFVAEKVENLLQAERFDLHLIHSATYYEEVNCELQALNGAVWTVWKNGTPIAAANYICEEGKHEFTEVVCDRQEACDVLNNFMHELSLEKIFVEDCYFLQNAKTMAQKVEKQVHPYIMIKKLGVDECAVRTCYINDIT